MVLVFSFVRTPKDGETAQNFPKSQWICRESVLCDWPRLVLLLGGSAGGTPDGSFPKPTEGLEKTKEVNPALAQVKVAPAYESQGWG